MFVAVSVSDKSSYLSPMSCAHLTRLMWELKLGSRLVLQWAGLGIQLFSSSVCWAADAALLMANQLLC